MDPIKTGNTLLAFATDPLEGLTFPVTNDHKTFENTPYATPGAPRFSLECRVMDRKAIAQLGRHDPVKMAGNGQAPEGEDRNYYVEVFVAGIASWRGVGNLKGEVLECNEANKRAIARNHWNFVFNVAQAILNYADALAVGEETARKN